jgi:hypothetical protein
VADIFLSYSRTDQERVGAVSRGLEDSGRSLWWDRKLVSGDDYGSAIEREIDAARCVVVAWSGTARESLWVRAEANAALDQGKLVQINLDRARLPLPFTMLHFLDFSGWGGAREQQPWPHLEREVAGQLGESGEQPSGRRPDPGGVRVISRGEPPLQGLSRVAMLGWAALGTAILLALSVVLVSRDVISAGAFGVISILALAVSAALLAGCAWLVLRIERASRR